LSRIDACDDENLLQYKVHNKRLLIVEEYKHIVFDESNCQKEKLSIIDDCYDENLLDNFSKLNTN